MTIGVEAFHGTEAGRRDFFYGGRDGLYPGVGLNVVSLFILPGGTLVNQDTTSLGAFLPGFGDGDTPVDDQGTSVPVTHMTGSISGGGASIVLATGQFAGATGTARVSGAVNADGDGEGNPAFNCLWEIDLDIPKAKQNTAKRGGNRVNR